MIKGFYPLLFLFLLGWQVLNAQNPSPPGRTFVFYDGNEELIHCKEDSNAIRFIQEFEDTFHIKFRYEYYACPDCPGSCDGTWFFYAWWMDQDWGIGSTAILAPDSVNYCVLVFIRNNADIMKISFPFSEFNNAALDTIRFRTGNYRLVGSSLQKQSTVECKFLTYEEKVEIKKQKKARANKIDCEIEYERKYDSRTKDSVDVITRKTYYNTDGSISMKVWLADNDTGAKEIFAYDAYGNLSAHYRYGWKGGGGIDFQGRVITWGLQQMTIYARDNHGNIRRIERENNWSESFSIDSNGNVIEQFIIQNDSVVRQRDIYKYDANGNRTEQEHFGYEKTQNGKDTIYHFKCFWKYDSAGNVTEFIPMYEYKDNTAGKTVYLYDSNGNRTDASDYFLDGRQHSHSYFKYDENGNLLESKDWQWHKYYRYDNAGNVTDFFLYDSRGVLRRHNVYSYEYYSLQPQIAAPTKVSLNDTQCDSIWKADSLVIINRIITDTTKIYSYPNDWDTPQLYTNIYGRPWRIKFDGTTYKGRIIDGKYYSYTCAGTLYRIAMFADGRYVGDAPIQDKEK